MSFAYFYLHHTLDKNSHVETLYDYSYGKINGRKKAWGKENEKNRPKEEKAPLCQPRKRNLAKSDKDLVSPLTPCRLVLQWNIFSRTFSALNPFGLGFVFAHYYMVILNWIVLSEIKKHMLQCDALPGKSRSIVRDTKRSCFSIGLWFY